MTNDTERMSSAPWICPIMMSGFALGTWPTDTAARKVCWPEPAVKYRKLTSSVRACWEFGVVTPATGAQNRTLPSSALVSHGFASSWVGLTLAAVPLSLAFGIVSFQFARSTSRTNPPNPASPRDDVADCPDGGTLFVSPPPAGDGWTSCP